MCLRQLPETEIRSYTQDLSFPGPIVSVDYDRFREKICLEVLRGI